MYLNYTIKKNKKIKIKIIENMMLIFRKNNILKLN
jgi:hypothetical protein